MSLFIRFVCMLHQLDGAKMSPTYVTAAESGRLSIFGLAAAKRVFFFLSFCPSLCSLLKMIKCNEARSQPFLIGALLHVRVCFCLNAPNYERFYHRIISCRLNGVFVVP